jgi:hypothetical protein
MRAKVADTAEINMEEDSREETNMASSRVVVVDMENNMEEDSRGGINMGSSRVAVVNMENNMEDSRAAVAVVVMEDNREGMKVVNRNMATTTTTTEKMAVRNPRFLNFLPISYWFLILL